MKKNPLIAVTLFAILLSFISCHDSQQEIILEIHPSEVNLLKGEFYDLNTWNSMWDDNLSVVWSSSDSSIVSVDETGKIHALQEGEAQIIAQTENASASCNVVVEFDSLMCPSNVRLILGEKLEMGEFPFYFYEFASHTHTDSRPIVLTSSNEEVMIITAQGEHGVAEAKSIGKAVITITAGEVLSASCNVEVYAITGEENGHTWVDMGFPSGLKWATCNVGASAPEEYGDYFAWGEVEPKKSYHFSTYKWYYNGNYENITKYCNNSSYGTVDNKTVLDEEDDAASVNWGSSWRMPTDEEMTELYEQCTWTNTIQNGVVGHKGTSKINGNSIFLPAAGYRFDRMSYEAGKDGYYWSSSVNTYISYNALALHFHWRDVRGADRNRGLSIRPVCQ